HAFDDQLRGGLGESGEDSAAMEPADAAREDGLPVEVARFKPRRSLVASVVEHHGRTHTLAAVAVDGGHVRSADAVVLETFVERPYTHRLYTLGDEVAD